LNFDGPLTVPAGKVSVAIDDPLVSLAVVLLTSSRTGTADATRRDV
jgi:hypothetical protein